MSWLRALSLVLILVSLTASAEVENVSEEVPRIISEQDNWLLINPLSFLYAKTTTTPKPQIPQHPYSNYPHYPYYPYHPPYPHYPHVPQYPYYPPYPPHPTQPTFLSTPPTKPTRPSRRPSKKPSTKPSRKPSRRPPTKPPLVPFYYPPLPFKPPNNGYYPWILTTPTDRQPIIFFISPSGSVTTNIDEFNKNKNKDGGMDDKNETDGGMIDKSETAASKVNKTETAGGKVDKTVPVDKGKIDADRKTSRNFLINRFYPHTEIAKMDDTFYIPEAIDDNQQTDFDDESEAAGRHTQSIGLSTVAESEEDNDTLMVDTNDIKLPLDMHSSSHTDLTAIPSNKNVSEQEALIYVKNFKQRRTSEAAA